MTDDFVNLLHISYAWLYKTECWGRKFHAFSFNSHRNFKIFMTNFNFNFIFDTICVPYIFRKSIFGWNCDHDTPLCDTPLLEDTPLCDTPDEIITQGIRVAIKGIYFCDPQGGKGVCVRNAATIKGQMRIYGNEGYNIEDAAPMKTAIESSKRLPDVVTVAGSVPPRIDNGECTWQGVSLLNNFEITDVGVRVWRAYGIGTGKLMKW